MLTFSRLGIFVISHKYGSICTFLYDLVQYGFKQWNLECLSTKGPLNLKGCVFLMITSSECHIRWYKDNDHREDAPLTIWRNDYPTFQRSELYNSYCYFLYVQKCTDRAVLINDYTEFESDGCRVGKHRAKRKPVNPFDKVNHHGCHQSRHNQNEADSLCWWPVWDLGYRLFILKWRQNDEKVTLKMILPPTSTHTFCIFLEFFIIMFIANYLILKVP